MLGHLSLSPDDCTCFMNLSSQKVNISFFLFFVTELSKKSYKEQDHLSTSGLEFFSYILVEVMLIKNAIGEEKKKNM